MTLTARACAPEVASTVWREVKSHRACVDPLNTMFGRAASTRSTPRLLISYALMTLVPVLLLGLALGLSLRGISMRRGLNEGQRQAMLVAETAIEPQLDGRPLARNLNQGEHDALERLVRTAVADKNVLRLRLRDLSGRVVFSDDRSGRGVRGDDDEALDAAHGKIVARLTHLNADGDDDGPVGVAAVEVYMPLTAGTPARRVGVLEVYLPYGPIAADVNAGLHALYLDLALGLAALFVVLFLITLSVSRGLRRELAVNAFLAKHDTLTELPNRVLFIERARAAVDRASRAGRTATLAILDLDHFKDINDALGHSSGDALLTELGHRLSTSMRGGDTVARLGGDEFGLVLQDTPDAAAALLRLSEVLSAEIEVSGLRLLVAPSIGYVTVGDASTSVETLMQQADVAMYAAKAQHSVLTEYRPGLDRYDASDLELAAELRRAISEDELVLHYQPQVDLRTGAIVAAEALLRWQHPLQGLLPPGRFLPMAEQTDLIESITEWVLARALADVKHLNHLDQTIAVAVNVSARSIVRLDFAQQVIAALDAAGVSSAQLVIEVTETALLTDPQRARAVLAELSAAGVQISIDDFGQGQTSLGYLSDLPIDELKVDRSFVTDLNLNAGHAAIVRSVVELGHNLSMRVVAEGVEEEGAISVLTELDCDLVQGYHLARPMALDSLLERLAESQHLNSSVIPVPLAEAQPPVG
jgi:diguanylate cyclase (GGDEF)-like protein